MNIRKYIIPAGAWTSLFLGVLYLLVFALMGGHANLAVGISFFALSLSIKSYGNSTVKQTARRKRD